MRALATDPGNWSPKVRRDHGDVGAGQLPTVPLDGLPRDLGPAFVQWSMLRTVCSGVGCGVALGGARGGLDLFGV